MTFISGVFLSPWLLISLSLSLWLDRMSASGTIVDLLDPFGKRSLKKKQKRSQGSYRYKTGGDFELTALPLLREVPSSE